MMGRKKNNISAVNFKKAINYLKRNGERGVGIIGGEPTLHPDFFDLLDYTMEKGMQVQLFTNGIMNMKTVQGLAAYNSEKLGILLNLNDADFYSPGRLSRIKSTFQSLNEKISLGYTIYKHDFSLDFHREMILEYGLNKRIRIGLAAPIGGDKTGDFFSGSDSLKLGRAITDIIIILEKSDILVNLDCGFCLCMFTTEQLGIMTQKSAGFSSKCEPIIDIDTELNMHHCFPLTGLLEKPMKKYPDLRELKRYYSTKLEGLKVFGNEGECLNCKYLKRRQCRGWCLGRIFNSQKGLLEKVTNICNMEKTAQV
jgi:hypothetical protein